MKWVTFFQQGQASLNQIKPDLRKQRTKFIIRYIQLMSILPAFKILSANCLASKRREVGFCKAETRDQSMIVDESFDEKIDAQLQTSPDRRVYLDQSIGESHSEVQKKKLKVSLKEFGLLMGKMQNRRKKYFNN